MKKQQTFKRTIAKNGQIYYYKNGKRLSTSKGLKQFVKNIYSEDSPALPIDLNPQERKSFNRSFSAKQAAKERYTYGFKPIPKVYAQLMQRVYPKIDMSVKDLSQWINPDNGKPLLPRFSDILRTVSEASKDSKKIFEFASKTGLFKQDNQNTTIIDIADIVKDKAYNKYKITVISPEGKEITGRKLALDYLREFEQFITEKIRELNPGTGILGRFNYRLNYNFENKTLTISLKDQNPKDTLEKILKNMPDYIQSKIKTSKKFKNKEDHPREDKYEDVQIQLFYS